MEETGVEQVIASAPPDIDHIFVAFHEPAFPRYRHIWDSFNASPEERDAFWNMLVAHNDIVRAVFVAHTHTYSRMRVLDPLVLRLMILARSRMKPVGYTRWMLERLGLAEKIRWSSSK